MAEYSYEKGRLNLPFVGFCTFAKAPVCEDWDNIKADVAVLGVPNDMAANIVLAPDSALERFARHPHFFPLVTGGLMTTKTIEPISLTNRCT